MKIRIAAFRTGTVAQSRSKGIATALLLSTLLLLPTRAQAEDGVSLDKITEVEGITEYRMTNGLKVLLFPDPSKSTVTVNVTYRVGSRHEGRGETGMAHLLEHMVFKGTPTYPSIWGAFRARHAMTSTTATVSRSARACSNTPASRAAARAI